MRIQNDITSIFYNNITPLFQKTYLLDGIDITTENTYPIKILNVDITYEDGKKYSLANYDHS